MIILTTHAKSYEAASEAEGGGHGPVPSSAKKEVRLKVSHGHSHERTTGSIAPSGSTDTELLKSSFGTMSTD